MEHIVSAWRALKDKQNFVDGQPHNHGHAKQDPQHQEKVLSLGKSYIHNLSGFQSVPKPTVPQLPSCPLSILKKKLLTPLYV